MSKNDITGDNIVSKGLSEQGRENFDRIFCKHDWCSDGDPGPGEAMTLTCSRCGAEQKAVPVVIVKHRRETCGEWEKK